MIARVGVFEGSLVNFFKEKSIPIQFQESGEVDKIGMMEIRRGHRYMTMISQRKYDKGPFNIILSINGKEDEVCQQIFNELKEKLPFDFKEAPDHVKRTLSLLDSLNK